ncbi:carboxylesterase family protein [Streptomyces griseoincarnatus]
MSSYWVNFVRTGDPNGSGMPVWPTVERAPEQVMEFGEGSALTTRPRSDAIDFWMDYDGPIP